MLINGLWEKLEPRKENLDTLRKDLAEGKVPELPYFIVDQEEVKEAISSKLKDIDGARMQTSLIISPYGNGKTNLLKYLKLFFEKNISEYNIDVIYSRADIEQPDVILLMLKLIQNKYTDLLIEVIKIIRNQEDIGSNLANNFDDNFSAIEEYTKQLFNDSLSDEDLRKLIYLGTGRLYTKGHFNNFGLEQLQNFNRREILVLFLNILAERKKYIIFAIDEVEKVIEKSKLRFNQFLTSYRELIDLFNKIKGHFIITCLTDAQGTARIQLANEAFYTRVKPDIKELPAINKREDIRILSEYLNELFGTQKNDEELDKIVTQLYKFNKEPHNQINRYLIRQTVDLLVGSNITLPLEGLLRENNLSQLFDSTHEKLELAGVYKSLHQKFFDPLEYYLENNFFLDNGGVVERRDYQAFIDEVNNKVHYFIFNEDSDIVNINKRVNALINEYQRDIIIYSPIKLELKNSSIELDDTNYKFQIVDYEANKLFVLLNMYRDNFENQDKIGKLITTYTENYL